MQLFCLTCCDLTQIGEQPIGVHGSLLPVFIGVGSVAVNWLFEKWKILSFWILL